MDPEKKGQVSGHAGTWPVDQGPVDQGSLADKLEVESGQTDPDLSEVSRVNDVL